MPYLAQQVAVSPPPMMVTPPAAVSCTTLSISARVPCEKFSNSNTPAGLLAGVNCNKYSIKVINLNY